MEERLERCPVCMETLPEGENGCDNCGWMPGTENEPPCLPPGTELFGRYVLGKGRAVDGAIEYSGWDKEDGRRVLVAELFTPECRREPETGAVQGLRGNERERFLIGRAGAEDAFSESGTVYAVSRWTPDMEAEVEAEAEVEVEADAEAEVAAETEVAVEAKSGAGEGFVRPMTVKYKYVPEPEDADGADTAGETRTGEAVKVEAKNGPVVDIRRLCQFCMHVSDDPVEVCPNCGRAPRELKAGEQTEALPPWSFLGGRYLLGEMLFGHAQGNTYIGWDLTRSRAVAIREFCPGNCTMKRLDGYELHITDEEAFREGKKRFLEEGEVFRTLGGSPGIPELADTVAENGTVYHILDIESGMSLTALRGTRGGRISVSELMPVIEDVVKAAGTLAEREIKDLGIEPGSIFAGSSGKGYLLSVGGLRRVGDAVDKKRYWYESPEETPAGGDGALSDVYSLATAVYWALTGQNPRSIYEGRWEQLWNAETVETIGYGLRETLSRDMNCSKRMSRHRSVEELWQEMCEVVSAGE